MDKYAIYSYFLSPKPQMQGSMFDDGVNVENLSLEQRFELLFGEKVGTELPIQKIKRGAAEKYDCRVVRHDENLVLLRLVNKKDKQIWEEQPTIGSPLPKIEETTIKSTPYCYIIIDNRPDVRLMAIQSNSAAWRNPNTVKDLIQESLNWLLTAKYNWGMEVTIQSKMMPTQFWDYVDRRRQKEGVSIKSMTFSFTNYKRRPDIDIKSSLSSGWNHMANFMEWIDRLGGDTGEFKITPPKDGDLIKRRSLADIRHMVEICMNSNYALTVTFSDGITYKCNQNLRAEVPMDDESIRIEFEGGNHLFFTPYRLTTWMDKLLEQTKKYQDVEDIKPKPSRKAKKQVS